MSTIPEFRSIAKEIQEFVTMLCPYLEKALFLFFFGLLFGIANYALLVIASSQLEKFQKYLAFGCCVWCIFNIIFNYIMSVLVKPGSPKDIPAHLLAQINHNCRKCGLIKPPRTHHCSLCNQCIVQMDHHCPWIGNCVGHHNRQYFINFLTYTTLGLGEMLFFVSFKEQPLVYTLILTLFVCLIFFTLYHWFIAIKGKTSLEICWEDPRYTPSSSYSSNLEIVFGTSNILYCLLPNVSILKHRGDRWDSI